MFISKCCGCLSEDKILQQTGTCPTHNKPFMYICLQPNCSCLLCPLCLQLHKGHQFVLINTYFTQDFRVTLKDGTSANGYAVHRMFDHVLSDVEKMRGKLNNQIDKLEATLRYEIQKLKIKYPLKNKFGISGTNLNPNNVNFVLDVFQRQKNRIWVPSCERYIRYLMGQVTTMIDNLIDNLEECFSDKKWETIDEYTSNKMIEQFVKKYAVQYDPDRHYFTFSGQEKHYNIKVAEEGLLALYNDTNPSKPAALTDKPFTRKHDTIYFKVSKMDRTAKLFDASVIMVGVCVPQTAKMFGYRNLYEPTHGAYMIGSNGKCYHSNLEKYNKKTDSFSFTRNDVIAVQIVFDAKQVHFSKWGFFHKKFKMQLNLDMQTMQKLKPLVLFDGDKGAIVHIVDENQFRGRKTDPDQI